MTAADIAGAFGLAFVAGWPLFRTRAALLTGQAAGAAAFAIHYALLEAWTGAAMSALSVAQVAISMASLPTIWRRFTYGAVSIALAASVVATWNGWPSVCAGAGLAFVTVARWQGGTAAMRLLSLLAALAWVAHDILTSSAPGLLADALCIGTLIYGWRRDVATG